MQNTELDPSRSGHETFPLVLGGYYWHNDTKHRYLQGSFVGTKRVPKGGVDASGETQDRTRMALHWSELLCPYWPCMGYAQTQNTRALGLPLSTPYYLVLTTHFPGRVCTSINTLPLLHVVSELSPYYVPGIVLKSKCRTSIPGTKNTSYRTRFALHYVIISYPRTLNAYV